MGECVGDLEAVALMLPEGPYDLRMVVKDPGLNPYQPNHKRNVPSTTSDAL
jgi:hypothetical protein